MEADSSIPASDERDLGNTCCRSWPRTCAEVQAQTPTYSRPCDFCLYGPEDAPVRHEGGMSLADAVDRMESTERARGERFREAVVGFVEGDE